MSSTHWSSSGCVSSPGALTAIPSAIVRDVSATCTPITSTSGRADLTAIATPLQSPPPPTGIDDAREVRDLFQQLEPERALARDHVGVVERVHEREPVLARPLLGDQDALVDRVAADVDDRALVARRLGLGDRRVGGDVDLAAHAQRPRGGGQRLRVVAGRGADHAGGAAFLAQRRQLGAARRGP